MSMSMAAILPAWQPLECTPLSASFPALHRRFSTVSNVSCQPKIKESPPLHTLIDIFANRTISCGSSDEDGASIGDRFDVLGRGQGGCRCQRLSGRGGG